MTEPTGNEVVDTFLEELDLRCDGGRDTPPDSAARLRQMRPIIRSNCIMDTELAEVRVRALADKWGFDFGP